MTVITEGHTYLYECEKVCRIFYPTEKMDFVENPSAVPTDETRVIHTKIERGENAVLFVCLASVDTKTAAAEETALPENLRDENDLQVSLARVTVKVLSEITGIIPPWGVLTGVRPSKLLRNIISQEGEAKALDTFVNRFGVSEPKTNIALAVARAEQAGIRLSTPASFSLYVSVPFCPTRCSYCSFVSHSIGTAKKLMPDYVRLLCEEIRQTAQLTDKLGLKLETVYFGGGTPTALSAGDLQTVLAAVNENFDARHCREFTVEAGRPDTVDEEKLRILKNAGVNRISINPQTFSNDVLKNIGRNHTVEDFYEKFRLARKLGFDNINTDLIAGLPGDSVAGFCHSIDAALALAPENITVHTLALKRSSTIVTENETFRVCRETSQMVDYANRRLTEGAYLPYYMYRQSKSVGNLENVGWCLKHTECLYNIYMMEEIHSVFAVGGGAVTKLKAPDGNKIERIYNYKYPYEYISRFEELIARKQAAAEFYQLCSARPCEQAAGSR